MGKSDNASEFLDLYRRLEGCIREHYDVPEKHGPVAWLGRNPGSIQERCRGSQILRGSSQPALAPGECRWRLRRRAERLDADTPAQYACGGRESSQGNRPRRVHAECVFGNCGGLRETRPARDGGKCYTHVPILEDGIVRGVFSENTLLSYLYGEEIVCIDDETTFSSLAELLPVDAHASESFRFVPRTITLAEVAEMFTVAMRRADRIGMVFITHSGKPSEKVLGIITAWDVAAYL